MAGVPARSRTCTLAYVVAVTPVAVSPCTPAYKPSGRPAYTAACVPAGVYGCVQVTSRSLERPGFGSLPLAGCRAPASLRQPSPQGLRWAGWAPRRQRGSAGLCSCTQPGMQAPPGGRRAGCPCGQRKCGLVFVWPGTTSQRGGLRWRGPRAAAGGSCGPVFVYAVRHAGRTLFVLRGTRAGERRKPRGPPARLGYLGGLPDPRARRPPAVVRSARWPTGTWQPPIAGRRRAARDGSGRLHVYHLAVPVRGGRGCAKYLVTYRRGR